MLDEPCYPDYKIYIKAITNVTKIYSEKPQHTHHWKTQKETSNCLRNEDFIEDGILNVLRSKPDNLVMFSVLMCSCLFFFFRLNEYLDVSSK